MATLVVNSTADFVDGSDDLVTLREAVAQANALPDADTIRFTDDVSGSILLTQGSLVIEADVTIEGPGADKLTIDASGNDLTPNAVDGLGTSAFVVSYPDISVVGDVTISGLTIQGGDLAMTVIGFEGGGAIALSDRAGLDLPIQLTVRDSVLRDNHAGGRGGAIYSNHGVTLDNVWIDQNSSGLDGGAVFARGGLFVFNSTISNNTSRQDGGAIETRNLVYVVASTITGNLAGGNGGAVNTTGFLTLHHSTIVGNAAEGRGGGIWLVSGAGQVNQVSHTILANEGVELNATISRNPFRFSIIRSNQGMRIRPTNDEFDSLGNLIGSLNGPVDPLLGDLQDHGGLTPTHFPLEESPAVNRGEANLALGVPLVDPNVDILGQDGPIPELSETGIVDQNGFLRFSGSRIDLGAAEFQFPAIGSDLNGDAEVGCHDIDLIAAAHREGIYVSQLDIMEDGRVDASDVDLWLSQAAPGDIAFQRGDADLDGHVNGTDLSIWSQNRFLTQRSWCHGDFDGDGTVDGSDFNIWVAGREEAFASDSGNANADAILDPVPREKRQAGPNTHRSPQARATRFRRMSGSAGQ